MIEAQPPECSTMGMLVTKRLTKCPFKGFNHIIDIIYLLN